MASLRVKTFQVRVWCAAGTSNQLEPDLTVETDALTSLTAVYHVMVNYSLSFVSMVSVTIAYGCVVHDWLFDVRLVNGQLGQHLEYRH